MFGTDRPEEKDTTQRFNEFNLLRDMDVVCATHCTQHKEAIMSLYPEKFIRGGVGTVIEL